MVILSAMKTAISIPDALFESAERRAKAEGLSRSAFYCKAIEGYLAQHRTSEITEALNRVYENEESGVDPLLSALAADALREEW